MNTATATEATMLQRLLQELIDCGEIEASLRSYSGRCMYGKTCVGLEFDRGFNEVELGVRLAAMLIEEGDDVDRQLRTLVNQLRGQRGDSMGLGSIIYWPDVPFVGEERDEDDEDVGPSGRPSFAYGAKV